MISPTAFTLFVNNLIFVNCSLDFAVSEKLGFPYARQSIFDGSEKRDFKLSSGKEKINTPLFQTRLYLPSRIIAQPIFKVSEKCNSFYDTDYVKNNSYSYEQRVGKVFYFKDGNGKLIEKNDIINFSTSEIINHPQSWPIVRPTLELQIELLKRDIKSIIFLNKEERDKQVEAVNEIIRSIKEQINTYIY